MQKKHDNQASETAKEYLIKCEKAWRRGDRDRAGLWFDAYLRSAKADEQCMRNRIFWRLYEFTAGDFKRRGAK